MTDNEQIELSELCSLLVDGALTAAQHSRLEEMLRHSEEARRFYVRTTALSASLFHYAGEMQSEPANIIRPPQWRRWAAPLAAAAVLTLGLWVGRFLIGGKTSDDSDDTAQTIAHLSGAKDCQWVGTALQNGDEFTSGQRLELKAGFAEITFDSGAQLVLEGPATLDLRSAWEAELQRGTVKANVPTEAIGFRLANAEVEVVDLGTEFSMTADGGGATEVFVLKGAVEVQPRTGSGAKTKSVLREKQSRRFAKHGTSEVRDSDAKFQRLARKAGIERLSKPLNFMRWRFDETAGDLAAVETSGFPSPGMWVEPAGSPHWAEGRWGKALALDGNTTARLDTNLRRPMRTVAMWVRLPEGTPASGDGIATIPLGKAGLPAVEFLVNSRPGDGTPGALRLQSGDAHIVGSTQLRDGRWHHLAAVFSGNQKAGKPSISLYVDGRLESPTGRFAWHRAESAPEPEQALLLGTVPSDSTRLIGQIDELILTDRPLAPMEIRHLMYTNDLLSPESLVAN